LGCGQFSVGELGECALLLNHVLEARWRISVIPSRICREHGDAKNCES
jgi:hypothetical protein